VSVFPYDNIWNVPVDTLPVAANSAAYVNTIGAGKTMHADFGSGTWDGGPIGIPFVAVPGTQARVPVTFDYADESDPGPYPIPPNAPIEGGPDSSGDRHVLVVDQDNCILYELFDAWPQANGSWQAGSGAIFNLRSNALRPAGWTSADAAGLPILAGLVRYDEVAAGEIRHALRFTAPQTRQAYVWPARHYASSLTGSQYPPMGQRFRLKAGYDISGFAPDVRVILAALKKYGMILADNGSAWYLSGAPDERWDNDDLHQLSQIPGSAFEAVDESSLMIDQDSGRARTSTVSKDFNGDGQDDILWRYYGAGGYNRAWFLGDMGAVGLPLTGARPQMVISSAAPLSGTKARGKTVGDQQAMGVIINGQKKSPLKRGLDVMGIMSRQASQATCLDDPRKAGGKVPKFSVMSIADPRQAGLVQKTSFDASAEPASLPSYLGGADVMPVGDLNWQIVGTGDFNNDTYVDILWRYNGAGGSNVVWFMNGTQWTGSAELLPVADLSWKIVGTGDFNKDGSVDILWRNSASGSNVVWYMSGTQWNGSAALLGVSDPTWQIVGTGDFNRDGNVDILWRYSGAGGYNVVWYMTGATWSGSAELIPVADPAWQIMGTGDFNRDGRVDILWRYNGPGGAVYIWYLNGTQWMGGGDLLPVGDLTWKIITR
jgi:hypothetical protein